MERLIQHIPEKHFKMIRYYGVYSRSNESYSYLNRAISKEQQKVIKYYGKWRYSIFLSFGYDPLNCDKCGTNLELKELVFHSKKISLQEMYEKAKHKARGGRSPTRVKQSQFALPVIQSKKSYKGA